MKTTERALEELNKIVELFSTEQLPNVCAKVFINSIEKPCSKWSISNQILMLLSDTEDARGFKQWKEVDRSVKGGSKALYILAPILRTKKTIDEKTGEEKEEKFPIGFRCVPVFRHEDTIGKPLPVFKPKEIPPLTEVAQKWGVKIRYAIQAGAWGSFSPTKNTITLGTEDWGTFFHELAHKAHSKIEELEVRQNPEQEAIAQLTSATLSRLYGKEVDGYSWNYVASYSDDKTPLAVGRMCMKVLTKTQKVLELILKEEDEDELL